MFGIPEKFADAFVSAWQEPLHGVKLTWLELVIIKNSIKKRSISEIMDILKSRYTIVEEMNVSRFYRIVNNLVENGYLRAEIKGREKQITTTEKGVREYGRLNRFILEDQINQIRQDLIAEFVNNLMDVAGDISDKSIAVFAPRYIIVLGIIEYILNNSEMLGVEIVYDQLLKQFHFINYRADDRGRTTLSSIWDGTPGNWPLKDNFADIIIITNAFTSFPESEFMSEVSRVLKEGGHVAVIEVSPEEGSRYSEHFLNQLAFLMSRSSNYEFDANSPWVIDPYDFQSMDDVVTKLEQLESFKIIKMNSDFINFQILAKKISS